MKNKLKIIIFLFFSFQLSGQNFIGQFKRNVIKGFKEGVPKDLKATYKDSVIEILCGDYRDGRFCDTARVWIARTGVQFPATYKFYFTDFDLERCDSVDILYCCDSCAVLHIDKYLYNTYFNFVKIDENVYYAKRHTMDIWHKKEVPKMVIIKNPFPGTIYRVRFSIAQLNKGEWKKLKRGKPYRKVNPKVN